MGQFCGSAQASAERVRKWGEMHASLNGQSTSAKKKKAEDKSAKESIVQLSN
jgi:hypothetical protein